MINVQMEARNLCVVCDRIDTTDFWTGGFIVYGSRAIHKCKGWLLLDVEGSIVACQWPAPVPVSKVVLLPSSFTSSWGSDLSLLLHYFFP